MHPQDETYWGNVNPIGLRSCYDEGKRCAETLFFDYRRQHDLPIKVVRIFTPTAPRMQPDDGRVVSNFIVQALAGQELTVYGDGSQTRSFCYVDDMIDGLTAMMATAHEVTGPINLEQPERVVNVGLATKVSTLAAGGGGVRYEPLPADDPKQRQPDITRARETLGWAPKVDLDTGLARTVEWFRSSEVRLG